ncbi:hypothetical protein BJX99DRAFT_218524 [Aspergillus californicus]
MLFAKSTLFVALFALSKIVAATGTTTPACLLQVVGPEQPGDLKTNCKTNGDEIQSSIRDVCGDDAQAALKYYAGVCEDGGFKVDVSTSSTSTSTSGSSTSTSASTSDSESSTSSSSADSTSTDSASSNSESAAASSTNSSDDPTETNGASSDKQVSAAAFAAIVFLGFAATL